MGIISARLSKAGKWLAWKHLSKLLEVIIFQKHRKLIIQDRSRQIKRKSLKILTMSNCSTCRNIFLRIMRLILIFHNPASITVLYTVVLTLVWHLNVATNMYLNAFYERHDHVHSRALSIALFRKRTMMKERNYHKKCNALWKISSKKSTSQNSSWYSS